MENNKDALWEKIDKQKEEIKKGKMIIEQLYGAITGMTYAEYEGKGGIRACIDEACNSAKDYLRTGKILDRDIKRRSQQRIEAQGGKWLTAQDVCRLMNVSDSSLRRSIRDGTHPPYIRFQSSVRFPSIEFKEWTRSNTIKKRRKNK